VGYYGPLILLPLRTFAPRAYCQRVGTLRAPAHLLVIIVDYYCCVIITGCLLLNLIVTLYYYCDRYVFLLLGDVPYCIMLLLQTPTTL